MTDANTTTADPPAAGTVEQRVGQLETEQREQRGLLEQILTRVSGGQAPAPAAPAPPAGGPARSPADLAAEVRRQVLQEIQDADRRRAAEQAETKWRDDVNTTLEKVRREKAPREPETGVRAVFQRMVIGRQG